MLIRSQTNINEFNELKFAFYDHFMANMLSLFVLGGGGSEGDMANMLITSQVEHVHYRR
jgi:hypothetical protein